MYCIAKTKKGIQCKNKCKIDEFCGVHKNGKEVQEKFGQTVSNRSGSTRNGYAVSIANAHKITISYEQILSRNLELGIDDGQCYYCDIDLTNAEKNNDHLIPSCNTTHKIFGHNNSLNKVPSCSKCNGSKGGKVNSNFAKWLKSEPRNWDDNKIEILFNWISKNQEYLYLNDNLVDVIIKVHETINLIHKTLQECSSSNSNVTIQIINALIKSLTNDEKKEIIITPIII